MCSVNTSSFTVIKKEKAHNNYINSISWAPAFNMSFYNEFNDYSSNIRDLNEMSIKRFCTGGNDNMVKIWKFSNGVIEEETSFDNHKNWVRDVAWLKYLGARYSTIATCGEDGLLVILQMKDNIWVKVFEKKTDIPILTCSWSNCGSYLACSCGDNQIYVYVENISGKWDLLNKIDDSGNISVSNIEN